MRSNYLSLILWFLLISSGFVAPFVLPHHKATEVFDVAPHFVLVDTNGAEFNSTSLHGKVWLINFFFSTCQGVCPAMNGRVASVYRHYEKNPMVKFLSVTVDPEIDTPPVLAEYATRFKASPDRWIFLTGPLLRINSIIEDGFHLGTDSDKNRHTGRVVLVDQQGRIRHYFQGTESTLAQDISTEIEGLLQQN